MARIELKGIHRVKRKLADGSFREHHYAWRGGPKFWTSGGEVKLNSPEYIAALSEVAAHPKPSNYMTHQMVDDYISSAEYRSKKPRTRADYRKWALRFAEEFKEDPATLFEDPRSRGEVNEWRQRWSHSPKQYDYAGTVVSVILNWARDAGKIKEHHCDRLRKIYASDRSEIVWTPANINAFNEKAPTWVQRILGVALETGLRPGDLIQLTRNHIEQTDGGRRLKIRTNKRGRIASIPVTPNLAAILDQTPRDQMLILTSANGKQLTEHRASEGVRQWRDKAGLTADTLGYELRLSDARGTAATRLLRADLSLNQIAVHMGWSLRHAANVIERYAAASPSESDDVLVKLAAYRKAGK